MDDFVSDNIDSVWISGADVVAKLMMATYQQTRQCSSTTA